MLRTTDHRHGPHAVHLIPTHRIDTGYPDAVVGGAQLQCVAVVCAVCSMRCNSVPRVMLMRRAHFVRLTGVRVGEGRSALRGGRMTRRVWLVRRAAPGVALYDMKESLLRYLVSSSRSSLAVL